LFKMYIEYFNLAATTKKALFLSLGKLEIEFYLIQ
jgi:hypothetical protein